uniref:Uncharacterized protein n=1 Tax=Anguilla anguilla TaxID=7936 RepID=A0A0E9UPL9_ANGAN
MLVSGKALTNYSQSLANITISIVSLIVPLR